MRVQARAAEQEDASAGTNPVVGEGSSDLTIADILLMLERHKWFILSCVVAALLIAVAYIVTAVPIYEASASLRIDPSRASSLGFSDLLAGVGQAEGDMVMTEIAIIKSDSVAIDTLDSLSDEDFRAFSHADKKAMYFDPKATSYTPAQEALLAHFKLALNVKQMENTQLVMLSFRDPNPKLAADMVNHAMQSYLKQSFDSRYSSVSQVTNWLSEQMNSLKDRAAEAQRRLANFQEQNNIIGTDASNNTVIDRLRLLNERLAEAQGNRIVREAQMRAAMSGNLSVLAEMFPSPDMTALQAEQATLYAQYAQMSAKFGPNYPPLAELKRQMQKTDAEVERTVQGVRARAKQDYETAQQTEQLLQQQYDDQTVKAYQLNRQQAEYAILQSESNSNRDLYDTLQYKLQQAGVDAGLNGVNTMLVDAARAPLRPVEPKKTLILSFGLILGLFAGVGAAFAREAASDGVQTAEQVEHSIGYHMLALVPHNPVSDPSLKVAAPGGTTVPVMLSSYADPLSRYAEAYRSLRNSMLLTSIDHPYKTVLVTSPLAAEGKSSCAANLAVVLAQRGARVLLVDADLRRPSMHRLFGVKNGDGLSNLILGEDVEPPFLTPLKDLPNLNVLTAGKRIPLPSEALNSAKFFSLVQQWESEYDHVLIDSAPLLVVSDSLPIASQADAVVLVARYKKTAMRALKRTRILLQRSNANVAGVVLNDVSSVGEKYGGYGYGYGDYYNN